MRPPYPARHVVMSAIVEWVGKNYGLKQIAAMPGMPSRATMWRWGAEVPVFAQQMRQARAEGRFRMRRALHGDGQFSAPQAEAFLVQVRLGHRIEELTRRPEWPSLRRLGRWKKAHPEFRAALRDAVWFGRTCRPLPWPYDEEVADRIVLRLMRGETMAELLKDPALPGRKALRRWRRGVPEFAGALKGSMQVGARVRAREASMCTPELTTHIVERIQLGDSLRSLAERPGMPSRGTMYGWIRTRPEFAKAVAEACEDREDILADQAVMRLMGRPPEEVAAVLARIGAVPRRVSTMPRYPGKARAERWR